MNRQARERYLADQVMTAPPQKLYLMLVEGAIRFIHKAQQHWSAKEDQLAGQSLIRAQEIVGEVLAGFKREMDPVLINRAAGVYGFVLRSLVEGAMLHNEAKLVDALRILDIERETWRELCRQIGAEQPGFPSSVPPPVAPIPARVFDGLAAVEQPGRFSFDA